jgi:GxxExxY protein
MRVHRELGPGWNEEDYHRCFLDELQRKGLQAESKARGVLTHRQVAVDRFELDVMVEAQAIVELKHTYTGFAPAHFVQLINYMSFWRKDIGLLCNFGLESLCLRRLQMPSRMPDVTIAGPCPEATLGERCRLASDIVSELVRRRYHTFSLATLNELFAVEAKGQGANCQRLSVTPSCLGRELPLREVNAWLLDHDTLVYLAAHPIGPAKQNRAVLRSYMRQSRVGAGVLLNFSLPSITITPIAP